MSPRVQRFTRNVAAGRRGDRGRGCNQCPAPREVQLEALFARASMRALEPGEHDAAGGAPWTGPSCAYAVGAPASRHTNANAVAASFMAREVQGASPARRPRRKKGSSLESGIEFRPATSYQIGLDSPTAELRRRVTRGER